MWHPFRQKALAEKQRDQDKFSAQMEHQYAAAVKTPDPGARLLALDDFRHALDERGTQDWRADAQKLTAESNRTGALSFAGMSAGAVSGALMLGTLQVAPLIFLSYLAWIALTTAVPAAASEYAAHKRRKRTEAEDAPFVARLDMLRKQAEAATHDAIAAHMPEIARSPAFADILRRVAPARDAFAAAAARTPANAAPAFELPGTEAKLSFKI